MSLDPRRLMEEAARERVACELMARGGKGTSGRFVRVDRAGVVVVADDAVFAGGEDLRVWFQLDGKPFTFSCSVLRVGVPVPDRSQAGLMLGFVDGFEEASAREVQAGLALTILPPSGRGLELLESDVRVVDLRAEELSFAVPRSETLKFLEGGEVRVRFTRPGRAEHLVAGEVTRLAPGEGHYLYCVRFSGVADPSKHLQVLQDFASIVSG